MNYIGTKTEHHSPVTIENVTIVFEQNKVMLSILVREITGSCAFYHTAKVVSTCRKLCRIFGIRDVNQLRSRIVSVYWDSSNGSSELVGFEPTNSRNRSKQQ